MIEFPKIEVPSLLGDLKQILREYIDANPIAPKYRQHLESYVQKFADWLPNRVASHGKETDTVRISAWLSELSAQGLAPSTVNAHRGAVLALIRFATPDGYPLPRTDRIRRQKQPEKINPAFTRDEIRKMLAMAPNYQPMTERTFGRGVAGDVIPRHRPDGVKWSVWWEAFVRVAYASGQYLKDLHNVRWLDIDGRGTVTIIRHKTGKSMSFWLDKKAITAARAIGHPELLLPWPFCWGYFPREFKKFCQFAGVRELGPKSMRRAAITAVYMEQGEEAARILGGHHSFTITAKHYIDWSQARRPIVKPPRIGC